MKKIAFYLPQFHPIPENDAWWGKGFTEWTNVRRARPLFKGHLQPQEPGELGEYDLRDDRVRLEQIALAKSHGVDAFCYYSYWFLGKTLLETPLRRLLAQPGADFPFCLCWANETWSRAWDGREREILIEQRYSAADDAAYAEYLCGIFSDPRYLKVEGKPVFLIYRLQNLPDPKRFLSALRAAAEQKGFPGVRVFAVLNFSCRMTDEEIAELGIDDVADFQPNPADFPPRGLCGKGIRFLQRLWNGAARRLGAPQVHSVLRVPYRSLVERVCAGYGRGSLNHCPVVFPNWDNSPRRKAATVIQNDDPAAFEEWTRRAAEFVRSKPERDRFLFVNAWNEWAESAHLEPDRRSGRAFLEAFARGAGP